MSEQEVALQIREHQCFSSPCIHQSALTIINNVMAGAVRISLGYMTTFEDCDRVVQFIQSEYMKSLVWNKHSLEIHNLFVRIKDGRCHAGQTGIH